MDFVAGENLFQLVKRRGALPQKEALYYITQIADALITVHKTGLVHRDAHPGNIIVRPDGRAILIDFGIAKDLIPSTQTTTGLWGNEAFAPYEQIRENSREPNVDVYSLAATSYFILTAERPLSSIDRKLSKKKLIPPKNIVSTITFNINRAILRGMQLKASRRPQTIERWISLLILQQLPLIVFLWRKSKNQLLGYFSLKNPWIWFNVSFLGYFTVGYLFGNRTEAMYVWAGHTFLSACWSWFWADALIWARARVGTSVQNWAEAWALCLVWIAAFSLVGVDWWVGMLGVIGTVLGSVTASIAATYMSPRFSRPHTFLFLLITTYVSSYTGWLMY